MNQTDNAELVSVADRLWTVAVGAAAEESIRTGMPVKINNLPKEVRNH